MLIKQLDLLAACIYDSFHVEELQKQKIYLFIPRPRPQVVTAVRVRTAPVRVGAWHRQLCPPSAGVTLHWLVCSSQLLTSE